jgi:tetratricopeptide (TPR) repeat protein
VVIDLIKSSDEILSDGGFLGSMGAVGVLFVISSMLASLGQWAEALAAINETAAQLYANGATDSLEYGLSGAIAYTVAFMVNLEVGETTNYYRLLARDEAIAVLHQFAATYRQLAHENPARHELGLAVILKIRSESLWLLGRREEALSAGEEAVQLRRRQAQNGTAEHERHLALALRRLAEKSGDLGRHDEAVVAARESADIYGRLGPEHAVGKALHLVAVNMRQVRPAETVAPAEEAASAPVAPDDR